MSGTMRLQQLFIASHLSRTLSNAATGSTVLPGRNLLCRSNPVVKSGRRYFAAQAAPVATAIPVVSHDNSGNDGRNRRRLQSAFGSARNDNRGQRQANQPATDLQGGLVRLDLDVKRWGRVGLTEFNNILTQIKELPKIPSQVALLMIRCCGSLLAEISPSDRIKIADDLWKTLEKSCERLDISHYNALLKIHLENSHKFDPTAFLVSMEQKGVEANRVTYQRMAAYFCQQGDIEGATKILELMRTKDLPINESVFNVLIQGYARANDMENAQGVLDMMRNSKVEPSANTYRTLIEAYAEKGDMDKIRSVMAEADKNNVTLSDADYLDIVQTLAAKGHTQHIPELVAKLRKTPGFFHDAMNACLRLVDSGNIEIAYSFLSNLNVPRDVNERSGFGVVFLRKVMRYAKSTDEVWKIADDLRKKELNPWAIEKALETAMTTGHWDIARQFLARMAEGGFVVRNHYYWPIFAAYGKNKDIKGILELVGSMAEVPLPINLETMTDYVLPGLNDLSVNEILEQFKTRHPHISILNPLVIFLLDNARIKDAIKVIQDQDIAINAAIMLPPLAGAYLSTKDFSATETCIRLLQKHASQQSSMHDIPGQFLINVIQAVRDDEREIVVLLEKMTKSGLKLSNHAINAIDNRYRGRTPPNVAFLLDKLVGPDRNLRLEDEFDKHPRDMNIDELEAHLQELTSKNMNTRGILRRLLLEHCRERNVERVEAIKTELDASRFEYSAGMYAQMMDMYTATSDLDKAMMVKKAAEGVDPSFIMDGYKLLNLAALLVSKDQLKEAVTLLDRYQKSNQDFDFEGVERNVFRLLNAAAEKGDEAGLKVLWDKVSSFPNFVPTNIVAGPLVKIHALKNSMPEAVKVFNEIAEKYQITPWKGELMRRLVELEDTVNLQKVMDASIKAHGETNSLYDLAFAFLEAGRTRQAQKIFETPGMRARQDRLDRFAERILERNSAEQMEALLTSTRDVFDIDRDALYNHAIRLYGKLGDPDKALASWISMQEENLQASPRTLQALAAVLQQHKREIPFAVPDEVLQSNETVSPEENRLLSLIREDSIEDAMELKLEMDKKEMPLSVKARSNLIELLLQKERVKEAVNLTREMLEHASYPFPTVTKFLLSKLCRAGDISTLEELEKLFPEKFAGFIFMDKHLFLAHVNAGRSDEILTKYESDLQRRAPVTGLLALMRAEPAAQPRVARLVEQYAERGDLRGVAGCWSYFFSERKFDESRRLLERYPGLTNNLRAVSICERAHENNDLSLLRKLIETLREHSRSNVALAYSYLIGLHCHNRDYNAALEVLKEVESVAGLNLDELRLSALRVLEKGLQQIGQVVPFKVPEPRRGQQEHRGQEFDDDSAGRVARRV